MSAVPSLADVGPHPEHAHPLVVHVYSDNNDRTRVYLRCDVCGARFAGCKAKRLGLQQVDDHTVAMVELWGAVGVQTWRELPPEGNETK